MHMLADLVEWPMSALLIFPPLYIKFQPLVIANPGAGKSSWELEVVNLANYTTGPP